MTDTGWVCLEELGTEFLVVDGAVANFNEAIEACETREGTLASITNIDEFFGVLKIGSSLGELEQPTWIGVRSRFEFTQDSEASDTSNYEFLDGSSSKFFEVENEFPWRFNGPESFAIRQCVRMNPTT